MGKHTKIAWSDSTLNCQMGCNGCELWSATKVSQNELHVLGQSESGALPEVGKPPVRICYAGLLTERYGGANKGWPDSFEKPKLFPHRMKEAARWPDLTGETRPDKSWLDGYPRCVFLNDLGDTWSEKLDPLWLLQAYPESGPVPLIYQMAMTPHVWQFLTKRPRRMRDFFRAYLNDAQERGFQELIPANFWLGCSITDDKFWKARMRFMEEVRAETGAVIFLSLEPIYSDLPGLRSVCQRGVVQWVITGGASGQDAVDRPCPPERLLRIVDTAGEFGVSRFLKQLGGLRDKQEYEKAVVGGRTWTEIPAWRPPAARVSLCLEERATGRQETLVTGGSHLLRRDGTPVTEKDFAVSAARVEHAGGRLGCGQALARYGLVGSGPGMLPAPVRRRHGIGRAERG